MRIARQLIARETKTITCKVEINQSDVCRVLREYYTWYQTELKPDYKCYIGESAAKRLFAEKYPDFNRSIIGFADWCVWIAKQNGYLIDCKEEMPMSYEIPPTILTTKTGRTSKKILEHIQHMKDADEYADEDD